MNDREADDAIVHRRVRIAATAIAVAAFVLFVVVARDDDPRLAVDIAAYRPMAVGTPMRVGAAPTSMPQTPADPGPVSSTATRDPKDCVTSVASEVRKPELEAAQLPRLEATISTLSRSLRSDPDERARVTGMFLDSSFESIARLAATSSDPFVYATALQACGRPGMKAKGAPSCNLLSLAQWARIDPDNATPWLYIAAESAVRKDAAAVDEALYRVAAATNNRIYGDQLLRYVMPHVPAGAPDVDKAVVSTYVTGVAAAWQLPAYSLVTQYCAAPLLRDSNRWQACDGIARNFVEHPSTLLEKRFGFRIAERLKWPTEKLAALKDEDEALMSTQTGYFSEAEADSCHGFERAQDFWLQAAALGEVGALRALVVASGKSVATLAGEARAERELRAKAIAAEAAARPASAASGT